MAPLLVAAAALALIAWIAFAPVLRERRRGKARVQPFPGAWREILHRRVPLYSRMPVALQRELEGHVQVFLREKPFIGCSGFAITDEVRVTIAAQACLLLLNRRRPGYFPNLRQVLVYPEAFVVERVRAEPSGVLSDDRQVLAGESWVQGQVVLSWQDVDAGRSVAIHEFAHQLDQEKGYANGAPWLGSRHRYPRWSAVMRAEFDALQRQAWLGEPTLVNTYGATSPAEFFAVASETFFERPREMAALHPALYAELAALYRVDPARW